MKKNRNLKSALGSLAVAIIFAGVGIYAYTNNMYILLFRVIPLNEIACAIIAGLLLLFAIFQLVTAPKKDKEAVEGFQALTQTAQQAAGTATPLVTVCGVTVVVAKGNLGVVNSFKVLLNGYEVGDIKGKNPLSFGTNIAENTLTLIHSANGNTINHQFIAISGGLVTLNITIDMMGAVSISQA